MIQISENADRQIVKLVGKEGLPPTGGLRVGVKAGGCSGLSYVFAWEPDAKPGDQVIAGAAGLAGLRRPQELPLPRRHDARLRHQPDEQGIRLREPEGEVDLRLRNVFFGLAAVARRVRGFRSSAAAGAEAAA